MANRTQLYLSPKITEKNLEKMLNESLAIVFPKIRQQVEYRTGSTRIDKYQMRCAYFKDPEGGRQCHIHIKTTVGGIKIHYLSLDADKHAQKLFHHMADTYGGIFVKTDYDYKAEVFHNPDGE